MTPKEKAKVLVSKYVNLTKQTTGAIGTIYNSKKCALIAVDEVLSLCWGGNQIGIKYWQDIRNEIEQL